MRLALIPLSLALIFSCTLAFAQDAQIAVAANFTAAAEELGAAFAEETGQEIAFSFGATGQFYAQIAQGAPFDAFLSADAAIPARLLDEGLAVEGSEFTYAVGQLVLFSADPERVTGPDSLAGAFDRLAIAEPATAPYGAAAMKVIAALGLTGALSDKLVVGQNISQTYQFVATGNAEMGFVALSQVIDREGGSRWVPDRAMYSPITQDAVLLSDNQTARAFLDFIATSPVAHRIIASYGYGLVSQ